MLRAAVTIQLWVRTSAKTRRSQLLLRMWPALKELRAKYIDDEAIKAGAVGTLLYTDEHLILRDLCRKDPFVLEALSRAWDACSQGHEVMAKTAYLSMARRLYLVLATRQRGRANATECRETSEKDWMRDTHGKDHLTREDFFNSFFQLTDLNTEGRAQPGEYAAFILSMTDKITRVRTVNGKRVGGFEWRDDRAIWAEASVSHFLNVAAAAGAAEPKTTISTRSKKVTAESASKFVASASPPELHRAQATQASSEPTSQPSKAPQRYGVWPRLAWLTAFDSARKAEQAVDAKRAQLDIERMQSARPHDWPLPLPAMPPNGRSALSSVIGPRTSWAALTRGRARGLLSQRLEVGMPSPATMPLSARTANASSGSSKASATSLSVAKAVLESPMPLAAAQPLTSSSLSSTLSRARAEATMSGGDGSGTTAVPRSHPRRQRTFSHGQLAPILRAGAHTTAFGSAPPSRPGSPPPTAQSAAAPSPRALKLSGASSPPIAMVRIASGEQSLPESAAAA